MLNILKNTINRVFASGVDSDASAFITATGLSGTTQKSAITTLVKDLKSSGLWSKMKAVYPMVTDNRNLLSYTEDFSNAYWVKTNATIAANSVTAPDGTLTADTETLGSLGYIATTVSYNGNVQTYSCYVKKKTDSIGYIGIYDTVDKGFWFNFDTGLVTQSTSGVSNQAIISLDNGWYRVSFTFTNSNSNTYIALPTSRIASGSTTRGTDIYLWGAQLENGSTISTYQPILTTPSAFMASQMKYNLKDARDLDAAFRLTWSGGWTYSATGATPNGTNGYIDTNLVGNTNISQGNFGFGIYSRTNSSTVGAYGINGALHIYPKFTDGNTYYRIFGGGSAVSGQTTLGLIYGFNDSTSTSYGWFNGVKKQTAPSSNYTIPSTNLMFAGNVTGTGGYDSRQLSFGFASLYLNDSEAQLLNQIVEKYQVALSRGVQAAQSFYYNSAYSNEANTYLYSTQITGTTQVSAINTLINGLKVNNLWTKMKAVYPFVTDKSLQADMAAQMKFNLVNPQDSDAAFRLAFSGGWTYSTNGAQPNGTNGYADTKFIPNNNSILNSSHLSYYSRTDANGTQVEIGCQGSTTNYQLLEIRTSGTTYALINQNTLTPSFADANSIGMYIANRQGASDMDAWKNGVKIADTTASSSSMPDTKLYIGAYNANGTTLYFSTKQCAFATIGDGLTDAEALILYNLIQAYQTTLSRQV